jgi:hypothetical protein
MKRALLAFVFVAACADRPLPDNAASMQSGGSNGTAGSGGQAGSGGLAGSGGMGGQAGTGGFGGDGGTGGFGGDQPDGGRRRDGGVPDAGRQRDAASGLTCTGILQCAANCGTSTQCFQNCCSMGTQQACQEAQALALCGIQNNCLGGSNPLQCLQQNCPSQLQACTGF